MPEHPQPSESDPVLAPATGADPSKQAASIDAASDAQHSDSDPQLAGVLQGWPKTILVPGDALLSDVLARLNQDPHLPGVLVQSPGNPPVAVSRRCLDHALSKPFVRESCLRRSVGSFVKNFVSPSLLLDASVGVTQAIAQALGRPADQRYEPMVIATNDGQWHLAAIEAVLDAQRRLLKKSLQTVAEQAETVRQAAQEREAMQQKWVAASRMAGKAEIATSILHNVGNVLNSVNVSISCLHQQATESKVTGFEKAVALMLSQGTDLPNFFANDPRGQALPSYMQKLAECLAQEKANMLQEIERLMQSVDHMAHVISQQQSDAKNAVTLETINPVSVLQETVRMIQPSLNRHTIDLQIECIDDLWVTTDRHLLMQVLVNVLTNACHAVRDGRLNDRQVTVRLQQTKHEDADALAVSVTDNGMGIDPEALPSIFQHGFTTKVDGHGFGLHNAANTMAQLGGSLQAASDGAGCGACFTMTVPLRPAIAKQGSPETPPNQAA